MTVSRLLAPLAIAALVFAVLPAAGQQPAPSADVPLLRPTGVVLNLHSGVTDRRFVPALRARLEEALAPPVAVAEIDFDPEPFRRSGGQVDAAALSDALIRAIDWERNAGIIHFVLIEDDMRSGVSRFNFASTSGSAATPWHLGVVSLSRLRPRSWFAEGDTDPARTAERAFKLVAKNVARVAGYMGSSACLFRFPRSLAELDATPESFCEPDLSVLMAAGVARRPGR